MLVKETISADIEAAFRAGVKNAQDDIDPIKELADMLADAWIRAIQSADVQPGITVVTAGSPTTQTGATTGIGKLL